MIAYDFKIKMSQKDNEVLHFSIQFSSTDTFFQEPTMHKIVLTILHVFTDLILWEDRHRDNFKNQDVLSLFFFFLTDLYF